MEARDKAIEKFWKSVDKTDSCWNWIGFLNSNGNPIIRITKDYDNKVISFSPRRISLEINGRDISTEEDVISICKNKLCVNPDHLALGNEDRFWAKVKKSSNPEDCWFWLGGEDRQSYGNFALLENKKVILIKAHRYSFELEHKIKISSTSLVCHKCDNPRCVNPSHLFLGSIQDNNLDRDLKNRNCKGSSQAGAKLNEIKVKEIRELFLQDLSNIEISKIYNVSRSVIYNIRNKKTWKHVEDK